MKSLKYFRLALHQAQVFSVYGILCIDHQLHLKLNPQHRILPLTPSPPLCSQSWSGKKKNQLTMTNLNMIFPDYNYARPLLHVYLILSFEVHGSASVGRDSNVCKVHVNMKVYLCYFKKIREVQKVGLS